MNQPTVMRAKFGAEVQVTSVTLIFADGHTQEFHGDDAQTLGLKPSDRPNAISALQVIQQDFRQRNITPLRLADDRTFSCAAHYGEAHIKGGLVANLEPHPEKYPTTVHDRLIVSAKIDYTVTVRRINDG